MIETITTADIVEREIEAFGPFGPVHRHWLNARAPEKVRRYLEQARDSQIRAMARQGFVSLDINDVNTAAFAARNTSSAEINILGNDAASVCPQAIINQFCAIPANDARAGKVYRMHFAGLWGNTGTPTVIWTPRWGSSTTVATNVTLGASQTATTITGSTALPFYGEMNVNIRTAPPGATLGTAKGIGWVAMQIPVTSSQYTQTLLFGGTAATIDTTGQGAAGCGITMNITWSASSASNTTTVESFIIKTMN